MMTDEIFKHYTLGVPEMDREHLELFMMLNQLEAAINHKNVAESLNLLDQFFGLLDNHCKHEEELMRKWGFPYCDAHAIRHPESTHTLVRHRFPQDDQVLHTDCRKMQSVMSSHIDNADSQYVPYYKKWVEANSGE